MFVAKSFTLISLLTVGAFVFCSESDLVELEPSSCGHKRQLSREIKKMHRRFLSLIRPPSIPEVFDKNHVRTPSGFDRERNTINKDSEECVRGLQAKQYSPGQDELNRALLLASRYGFSTTIAALLEWGANVDAQDKEKRTAAMNACTYGNYEALRVLIDANASIEIVDARGKTALVYTFPGQRSLKPEEWGSLRVNETKEVSDPRKKCREIIESSLQKLEHNLVDSAEVESKCCIIL